MNFHMQDRLCVAFGSALLSAGIALLAASWIQQGPSEHSWEATTLYRDASAMYEKIEDPITWDEAKKRSQEMADKAAAEGNPDAKAVFSADAIMRLERIRARMKAEQSFGKDNLPTGRSKLDPMSPSQQRTYGIVCCLIGAGVLGWGVTGRRVTAVR